MMPKPSGWWSVGQSVISGLVLGFIAYQSGANGNKVLGFAAVVAVGFVFGLGELLNQSCVTLREHALELMRRCGVEDPK